MPPKCKTSARDALTAKRKKVMILTHKVDLLDRLLRGQSVAFVSKPYGVTKSTIRSTRKNEKVIRESVAASTVPSTKVVTHVRNVHIERMEKALGVWIEDNAQKNMPLNSLFNGVSNVHF